MVTGTKINRDGCWLADDCVEGNFSFQTLPLDGHTDQDTRRLIRSRSLVGYALVEGAREALD